MSLLVPSFFFVHVSFEHYAICTRESKPFHAINFLEPSAPENTAGIGAFSAKSKFGRKLREETVARKEGLLVFFKGGFLA